MKILIVCNPNVKALRALVTSCTKINTAIEMPAVWCKASDLSLIAKGIKISANVKLFGFKNSDLPQFNLENIEILINKNLIEKKLIKPLYLS